MDTAKGVVAAAADNVTVVLLLLLSVVLLILGVKSARSRGPWTARRRPGKSTAAAALTAVPDGPTPYPVIGALHAMDGHQDRPFHRFTELSHKYGPVFSMPMGSMPCVIVNDFDSIKEVLITNGSKFGGRPDFSRYNVLFAGDRNNCEYTNEKACSLIILCYAVSYVNSGKSYDFFLIMLFRRNTMRPVRRNTNFFFAFVGFT